MGKGGFIMQDKVVFFNIIYALTARYEHKTKEDWGVIWFSQRIFKIENMENENYSVRRLPSY